MFSGFYITEKGNQYIAKSMTGKTLVLTKGQFGSGALPEGTNITALTGLIEPIADLPISKQNTIGNSVITTTQFSNQVNGSILSPFYLMEAGIFGKVINEDGTVSIDEPEALLFYANALTTEKADYIPGTLTEFIINWPLTISGSEDITVEINESLIYPTMKEFNERVPTKTTAGGTAYALTVSLEDVPLEDGMNLTIMLSNDLGAYSTISYNEGEAYPIYNANGTDVTERQQIAGTLLNVMFSEANKCWYIVGGGSSAAIATETEAKAGIDNTKMMTPLRVANYVDKVLGDVNTILDSINGEVI